MTTVQLDIERPAILFADRRLGAQLSAAPRGARSLDQALTGVWEDLTGRHTATACPICGGCMLPQGQGGGACSDCGSTLS